MRHRAKLLAFLLTVLAGLTVCGCEAEGEQSTSVAEESAPKPTGVLKPVASFQDVNLDLSGYRTYVWTGDSVVYQERDYDELNQKHTDSYFLVRLDGTGSPKLVVQEEDGLEIFCMCADRYNALYFFGRETAGDKAVFFLQKVSHEGSELYKTYLKVTIRDEDLQFYTLYADGNGDLALVNSESGVVFLFNDTGTFVGQGSFSYASGPSGLVDGGADGCFLWWNEWSDSIRVLPLDFKTGKVGELDMMQFPSEIAPDTHTNKILLSGCEMGLLVSTKDSLWQYHPGGEATEVLAWNDINMNVNGLKITELRVGDEQASGLYEMQIFLEENSFFETAEITYIDEAYLSERTVLTLGTTLSLNVEESVRRFNRSNLEYYVEIWEYDQQTDALEAMLFDPRGIPDILDVSCLQTEILESKGLLENLEPYLENSDRINEDDLLDSILRAEIQNGEMTALTTRFSIATLASTIDGVSSSGWSVEEFLERAKTAEGNFLLYFNTENMLRFTLQTNLNQFVDFAAGKCSFDSPEFISLLEQLAQISYPKDGEAIQYYNSMSQEQEALLRGEGQVKEEFFSSLLWYSQTIKMYGKEAVIAGYPTFDGNFCSVLYPVEQYAVYSGSENIEGAWAYLESVLSKEQQLRYAYLGNGLPVRKDVMEACLLQSVVQGEYLSEEDRILFEKMLDELVMPEYSNSALLPILREELDAFFAGDKTADETASILQNRAQLYLDETLQ